MLGGLRSPYEIENDRFKNATEAHASGAAIHWYLRPLVSEWGSSPERLQWMFDKVASRYGSVVSSVVPGGLRWTEGIEYGLTEARDLPMPMLSRSDNEKTLSLSLWEECVRLAREFLPGAPVYRHSSCALSHFLGRPSITSVMDSDPEDCAMSLCAEPQRRLCAAERNSVATQSAAQDVLDLIGFAGKATGVSISGQIESTPPLPVDGYAIRQTALKCLADRGQL